MNKHCTQIEWEVIEDDARWALMREPSSSVVAAVTHARRSAWRRASSAAILLLLAIIGGWWWHSAASRLDRSQVAVHAVPSAVALAAGEWGPLRTLQTPSFVFFFRQHDAATVVAVAPQIEALYATLRSDFGLARPLGAEKLVVELSGTHPPGHHRAWPGPSARLVVSSPANYPASLAFGETDLVAQSMALPLIDYATAQASEQHAISPSWRPLLDGLRLWQLWHTDMPLSTWQDEVVQWVVRKRPTETHSQSQFLPEHYANLCATHRLFVGSPTELNIPLLCVDALSEVESIGGGRVHDRLLPLTQLAAPVRPDAYLEESSNSGHQTAWGRAVLLATLVDYAVTTYGRDRLPVFVAGLGRYDRYETLVPAVYGVSTDEFEAGWRADLAARYWSSGGEAASRP